MRRQRWKRIIVEFRKAPQVIFRGTPVQSLGANRLIFHVQPYQGIEVQFHAKVPGPTLQLQPVNMRFGQGDAFKASRYTGYEVMLYSCSHGDATLFSLRARQLGAHGGVGSHRARRSLGYLVVRGEAEVLATPGVC